MIGNLDGKQLLINPGQNEDKQLWNYKVLDKSNRGISDSYVILLNKMHRNGMSRVQHKSL